MRTLLLIGSSLMIACAGTGPSSQLTPEPIPGATKKAASSEKEATFASTAAPPAEVSPPIESAPPAEVRDSKSPRPRPVRNEYSHVVGRVASMANDRELALRAAGRGLSVVNVAWEDTGRLQGSSLGPNISDLSLQVRYHDGVSTAERRAVMPVIRSPNFSDRTADVRADRFFVRTGNEKKRAAGTESQLRTVLLDDVVRGVRGFMSKADSVRSHGNLHARRDSHFLVSAQAVFLPIPKQGKASFTPVLFNYQSAPESPAVMSILVTRQGTSITVVENRPEDAASTGWGQELFFNDQGQRTVLTAERRSDVKARIDAQGGPQTADDLSALAKGADVLFLVQIPLKHKNRGRLGGAFGVESEGYYGYGMGSMSSSGAGFGAGAGRLGGSHKVQKSDVEQAVLGHGEHLGPFVEGNQLELHRDPQFPIRITVQFYKATSNGVVSDSDLAAIQTAIESVYEHADAVGSLVLPENDRRRPTAWQSIPHEWFPW